MGLGKTYSTQYLADSNNNTGAAGQVLSTTSTGIDWADANTLPGAGLWLEIGNDIYNSNSGNVGIGTTLPGTKLEVAGITTIKSPKAYGSEEAVLRIGVTSSGTNYSDGTFHNIVFGNESVANSHLGEIQVVQGDASTSTASDMRFFTNSGGGNTATSEAMRITSAGGISFGSTGTAYGFAGQVLTSAGNASPTWITPSSGTVTGSGAATQVAFWDGTSSLSGNNNLYWDNTNGHLGIGDSTPGSRLKVTGGTSETSIYTVDINHVRNDANVATHAMRLNVDLSGADTTTADRTNSGLFLDLDSSANGDASNEHRIKGIYSDVKFSGFSDSVQSGYFLAESNYLLGKTAQLIGVFAQAAHDTSSIDGGVSNMYGVFGSSSIQDLGDVDNAFGGYFSVTISTNRGNANVGVTKGVEGHIDIDKADTITYGEMMAVSGIIDNNEGTVPTFGNQYLFKGDYQGTKGGNAYGIYCEGDKHYFDGNVGIGTTSPTADLHVQGSIATEVPIIRSGGFGNSGSKLELAETLVSGNMTYGFSFFNDGNSSNTLQIKSHDNSTAGVTAITINRTNALTTFSTVPIVGTRTAGDNTTYAASTAFVTAAITAAAPTVNDGTLTMTTTTGLDGGATFTANQSGGSAFAVSLDLSELTDMTQTMVGSDEFIVLDNSAERRKAASEIGLSIFDNDAGFTSNTGDITAVVAGTGLTGGGTSGSVELNVIGGDGITANADDIEVDSTVVRTTGAQSIAGFKTFTDDSMWTGGNSFLINDAATATAALVRVPAPGGAGYDGPSNSTGAIKIKMPVATVDNNVMMSFDVKIYDYTLDESLDMTISGYAYSAVNWNNQTVVTHASQANRDYTVRFGDDGTSHCVWIGELTSTWKHLKIGVFNFIGGHTVVEEEYGSGWDISVASAFDTVQDTKAGNLPVAKTATTLQTARTIAGVSFNGSANISLNNNAITNGAGYITSGGSIDGYLPLTGGTMSGAISFGSSNANVNLSRGSFITFYEDNSTQHAIGSRNSSGAESDDIRINSYGAVYINLDSNNNNTSGADFVIGKHGGGAGIISQFFKVSGETGNVGIGTTSPAASAKLTVMGNQTFGLPGEGTNINGRFISIEGNTMADGEGSGRMFFTEHNSTTAAMDNYGMSLGYRGGSTSIVGASGNTWTGLTQIGNGQWGMFGHNNSAPGALIMSGDRAATYVEFHSNDIKGAGDIYVADQIIHTGDTNTYMQFHAADQWRVVTGGSERLEVNNTYTKVNTGNFVVNNNIGVGTVSPTSPIGSTRYINVKSTGNGEIILDHTDAGATSDLGLYSWARNADHLAHIKASCDGSTSAAFISFHAQPSGGSFSNAASNEKMRIKSNGYVGIGTTSPDLKLDVVSGANNGIRISATDTTSNWRDISIRSYVSETQANALGDSTHIYTSSPSGTSTETPFSYYGATVIQGRNNGNGGLAIRLGNGSGHSTMMWMGSTGVTVFSNTVEATNFILSSDERLKENIEKACDNRIKADWKTFELKTDKGQKRYGVIAQELEKTNPEFVREDTQGFKSVAYIDLLIAKIAELEARLEKLEK